MTLDSDACYRALAAHDTRFDGRFYVGVASTGIYCRPICNVRMPRRENCRFFPSAAAAEVAGYRPCLRCRPELAPGHASVDASARLARGAVNLIENGVMDEGGIETLAARVGVTSRHLRRIFETEYGVSPVEYAQTQPLASGFASVRRFNDLFRTRYRMAPSRLRRERAGGTLPASLVFLLAYRAPYDWSAIHDFLARRAVAGIESVTEGGYARTVSIRHRGTLHAGRIDVRHLPRKSALEVSVVANLAPVVPALLSRVKHAFDLACDPAPVALALGPLAARHPGLRVPGTFDGFELAVRAIVGQQVSVRGARTVLGRLVSAFGTPQVPAEGALTHLFPAAAALAAAPVTELARVGLTGSRARAIIALAQATATGALVLEPEADVDATVARLLELPGVGAWTAQYIAMRALRWPDAFPAGDLVVRRMLGAPRPAQALEKARQWQPWRAYAVMHLWRSAQ
jgi:AraC family transcriptional regulator of adaptative response / DNA-3-methyladenine glycosylase II